MINHIVTVAVLKRLQEFFVIWHAKQLMKWGGAYLCLGMGALVVSAAPVRAEFTLCNQSFDVVNVAIGQLYRADFRTRGWWRIGPNQCANLVREPLTTRYIYVFAQDIFGKQILRGSVPMCVGTHRFVIDGSHDCLVRGYVDAPFIEVDTRDASRWTMFIAPRPS